MKISVIGTGYVGLVTGSSLANIGHDVTCIDNNEILIENLKDAIVPFYEKDLEDLIKKQINKKLKFSLFDSDIIKNSEIILIAVGTPSDKDGIDLSYIKDSVREVATVLENSTICNSVVIKSTVLPKTTDQVVRNILEDEFNLVHERDFGLGMNPEFLREGEAVQDFLKPDRIVIGFEDNLTKKRLSEIYQNFTCEKIYVNSRTAEYIKYVNNSLLALQISVNNEFANISRNIGNINYEEVIKGISLDRRWSIEIDSKRISPDIFDYFRPGYGYGGSCFPKDVKALYEYSKQLEQKSLILESVIEVNNLQANFVKEVISRKSELNQYLKILILGTSFKPGTDDIRESVSFKILDICKSLNSEVYIHDPKSQLNFIDYVGDKSLISVNNWKKIIENMDYVILSTPWQEYKQIENLHKENKLNDVTIIDAKNFLNIDITHDNYFTAFYSNEV